VGAILMPTKFVDPATVDVEPTHPQVVGKRNRQRQANVAKAYHDDMLILHLHPSRTPV
jgi:hypothetical protein